MVSLIAAATTVGVAVLYAVLLWFMPRLTRRDLYFAVTVAPGFRDGPEGRSILRRYRTELTFASVVAFMAFVAGVSWLGVRFVPGGFFVMFAASFAAFYRARQRVLCHAVPPTTIREAELHGDNRSMPGVWVVASGPFLLLAACAVYLRIHGEAIPTRLATLAGILAALSIMLYGTGHWVRSIHAGGPERKRELKFRRTVSAILLAAEYFITLQSSWIALAFRRHHLVPGAPREIAMVLIPLFLALSLAAMVVLARLGQGGSRVWASNQTPYATSAAPVGDRTQDNCWNLGIFYFNRDDPAVLVEKRFGLGYTFNFARPATWLIVSLMVMGILVPLLVTRLHR